MKKLVGILSLLGVVLLSGCAHHGYHTRMHAADYGARDQAMHTVQERLNPAVSVVNGQIEAPLVLYFLPNEKDVQITWTLPENSPFAFSENGIVPEGALTERVVSSATDNGRVKAVVLDELQTELHCPRQSGGRTFTCTFKNSKPGIYKYTIRVQHLQSGRTLERDPYIMPL